MRKLLIVGMVLISVNTMAAEISEIYTFGNSCNLWDEKIVCQKNGMQHTLRCDSKKPDLTFDYKTQESVKFKSKEECDTVKSLIKSASDENPVEIEISGTKVLRVRAHK